MDVLRKKKKKIHTTKNIAQIFEHTSYSRIRPCYQSQWLRCRYFRRASVWNWGLRNDYIQERLVKPNYVVIDCKTNNKSCLTHTHTLHYFQGCNFKHTKAKSQLMTSLHEIADISSMQGFDLERKPFSAVCRVTAHVTLLQSKETR